MLAENGGYVRSRIWATEVVAEIVDDALNKLFLIVRNCGSVFGCEARGGGPAGGRVVQGVEDMIQFERGAWRRAIAMAFHFTFAGRVVRSGADEESAQVLAKVSCEVLLTFDR